ncbi:hypothetical protein KAT92_02895 [Candidatus Babeliales bacterium]|nr:hypothetical protein [Candidatus Babeliales bacterium]
MKKLTKLFFVLSCCVLGAGLDHVAAMVTAASMRQEQASRELFLLLLQDNIPKENGDSYIKEQIPLLLGLGADPCDCINLELAKQIINEAEEKQNTWLGAYCLSPILEQNVDKNMMIIDWFFVEYETIFLNFSTPNVLENHKAKFLLKLILLLDNGTELSKEQIDFLKSPFDSLLIKNKAGDCKPVIDLLRNTYPQAFEATDEEIAIAGLNGLH